MGSNAIKRLEDLTLKLTRKPFDLSRITEFAGSGEVKLHGRTRVKSLLAIDDIGIVDVFMPAGEVFPRHTHETREIFCLYRGRLNFKFDDNTHRIIDAPYRIDIERRKGHVVLAIEDSKFACVTMPRDTAYPG